jgi:hypothetical protein
MPAVFAGPVLTSPFCDAAAVGAASPVGIGLGMVAALVFCITRFAAEALALALISSSSSDIEGRVVDTALCANPL